MKRLSLSTKIVYGFGDFASNVAFSLVSSYLTLFYTDIVGIAPTIVSVILLICRIWDGANDPIFGAIAERTRCKMGRFRPYILFGSPFLAVILVLCFTTPFSSETGSVIWAFITYIAMDMAYTVVNVSYGALAGVMTFDSKERVELNSYRMIGSYAASTLLGAITMPLLLRFSDGATAPSQKGYLTLAVIYGVVSLPFFFFVFKKCKEVIQPTNLSSEKKTRVPLGTTLRSIFGNFPLILVFLALFCGFMGIASGTTIYYLMYYIGRVDLVSPYYTIQSIVGIAAMLLMGKVTSKIGKKTTVLISLAGCAITRIALWMVPPENTTWLLILVGVNGFLNFAPAILMAMIPECVDYGEIKYGVRSDGTAYAAISMATKLAMAVGPSIGLFIMSMCGYVANADQSAQSLAGINGATHLMPAIFGLVGLIAFAFYPISSEKASQMAKQLIEKRGEINEANAEV